MIINIFEKIKKIIDYYFPREKTEEEKIEDYIPEKTSAYYTFNSKEAEKNFLLRKTSSAFNDSFLINYLKQAVLITTIEQRGPMIVAKSKYKNKTIQEIYEILYRYAPNTYYWQTAIFNILRDMEYLRFDLQPSMNRLSKPEYSYIFKDGIEKRLDCYEGISLSQHLLNTMNTYIDNFSEQIDKFYYPKFEVLLACLLHDFGKSKKLQARLEISNKNELKHEEISGHYIDDLAKRVDGKYIFNKGVRDDEFYLSISQLEKVKKAVIEHHKQNIIKGSLSELLKLIDHKTREKEYSEYARRINK